MSMASVSIFHIDQDISSKPISQLQRACSSSSYQFEYPIQIVGQRRQHINDATAETVSALGMQGGTLQTCLDVRDGLARFCEENGTKAKLTGYRDIRLSIVKENDLGWRQVQPLTGQRWLCGGFDKLTSDKRTWSRGIQKC